MLSKSNTGLEMRQLYKIWFDIKSFELSFACQLILAYIMLSGLQGLLPPAWSDLA